MALLFVVVLPCNSYHMLSVKITFTLDFPSIVESTLVITHELLGMEAMHSVILWMTAQAPLPCSYAFWQFLQPFLATNFFSLLAFTP